MLSDDNTALARATKDVPGGFAGAFDENGHSVLLLVEPEKRDSAVAVLTRAPRVPPIDYQNAEVRRATWTFYQLYAWSLVVIPAAADLGVSVTGIDQRANRVVIGAANAEARTRIIARLESLNFPCNLIQVIKQRYGSTGLSKL
jgi:hypothetical protein